MYTLPLIFHTLLFILSLAHAVPTTSTSVPSIKMILNNNCGFDVWVRQAVALEPGTRKGKGEKCGDMSGRETVEVKVSKGQKFVTPVPILKDTCGHSVKVARRPADWQTCYQYEFNWARENGKIWYNLSSVNGNPFTDVARQIGGPYGFNCRYFRCEPGQNGCQCDYPLVGSCATVGDIVGYLC